MILTTSRLTLRGPQQSDLNDLFAVFSNPDAMRYWSTAPHADRTVTQERLDRMITRFETLPHYFCLEHQSRVIGCAGMVPDHEIGFILHPDFWRKGLMTEALSAILPHVWMTTEVPKLIADADPLNAGSCGLLMSFGFSETHRAKNTFCINGHWSDSVYFELQRPTG